MAALPNGALYPRYLHEKYERLSLLTTVAGLNPWEFPSERLRDEGQKGDVVVVTGCCPIEQFSIAFSKIMGAKVIIAADINERKSQIGNQMGADHLTHPKKIRWPSSSKDWLQIVEGQQS